MTRALFITSILLAGVLVLGSCTRNNGDIGPWFGTWHVEGITAVGEPVNVEGDYFFQFQNTVFKITLVSGHEQVVESYGNWHEDEQGGSLSITFPDPERYYISMPGLERDNHFTITSATARNATLTKADSTGTTYVYRLAKQP